MDAGAAGPDPDPAAAPQLGGGAAAYPAALWSISGPGDPDPERSRVEQGQPPATRDRAAAPPPPTARRKLPPWPESLGRQGIRVRTLHQYPAAAPNPGLPDPRAAALLAQWPRIAARNLAPGLAKAVADLLDEPGSEVPGAGNRLVLAPDDSGQEEAAALAALALRACRGTATLVLVPEGAGDLAAGLARWLDPGPDPRREPEPGRPAGWGPSPWTPIARRTRQRSCG